jgi:hypothetical protein
MIRHFIFPPLAVGARVPQAVRMLAATMGQTATPRLLMTAVSGAPLLFACWLPASLTTVALTAITVGADEEKHSTSWRATKTLAEKGFRAGRHYRRDGLDSRGQLLAR